MNARQLSLRLTLGGYTMDVAPDGKLLVRPASQLTDELRSAIVQHKQALLDELELEHDRNMRKRFSDGGWRRKS